jgi:peptide/nickel transport system substrate-binding protein
LAKKLVSESGYQGEKVVLNVPGDQPAIGQIAQVTRELFQNLGLNVDFQVMDWGSVLTRRANQNPPDQGGWNAFNTLWGGLTVSNPGSSYPLRGNGRKGWFGWPTDEELESLREAWFDAPDLAGQKAIAAQIQRHALETVPYVPLGQIYQPTAFRSDIKDIVQAAIPLFWGVRRG